MEKSKDMQNYFTTIETDVKKAYEFANKAKKNSCDVDNFVDIPLTRNMAERVEGLISVVAPQIKNSGVVERIYELEKNYGKLDWRVALVIAEEVANEKFCKFKNKLEAIEVGIRVGIAYVTIGIVASPLEGFVKLELKKRRDNENYFCVYYSGPIRSAGGTAASVSVLIADYLRKRLGYKEYDITEDEIKRMLTEIQDYHDRVTNLQYFPSEEELEFVLKHLPIQIDGDPSEEIEVSNYKDLPRINTNKLRNGPCLVLAEGICQKAPKLWKQILKWGGDFGLEHWFFLEEFIKIQKELKAQGERREEKKPIFGIEPDYTYIKDLVGGRPVLTYPLRKGGFRLRYGRCRNTGLSSTAINPITTIALNNYIAIGTQLKIERPSKGTALSICDSIEGPVVKLKNGDVIFLDNVDEATKYANDIAEILFLGDILISYGDFLNRAHSLVPVGYCEEWWCQEAKQKDKNFVMKNYSFDEALAISKKLGIPLHPKYTFHWADISKEELTTLFRWFNKGVIKDNTITLPLIENSKRTLELLGIPHKIRDSITIEGDWAKALLLIDFKKFNPNTVQGDPLSIVNSLSDVEVRDKSGTYIGARMGRPEKAKMRKMKGSPHGLFPVGDEGGRLRDFNSALDIGKIGADFPLYFCEGCNHETIYPICENCNKATKKVYYCKSCKRLLENGVCEEHGSGITYDFKEIDIRHYFKRAMEKLNLQEIPPLIKGVRGTSNSEHIPEHLIKGILRALHNLYVNKDGTVRYDMTELPITCFKPKEIGTSIEKLNELGYKEDVYGKKLDREDQLLELKPQDVILPSCDVSLDEGADIALYRVASFIDDLLVKYYNRERFYNLKNKKDLVGHYVVSLAPHISAGIIGRIIGFSKTQAFYAHPLFHSACRRDADGDELCAVLLMDVLLNFSRKYLPQHRGAVQDAPLVITSTIIASEVDDMVFDMDTAFEYPLELYEAAMKYKQPGEVRVEKVRDRLEKETQYEGYGFTHNTSDINGGVRCSAYKSLPTMDEKVFGQMSLAEKIRAVDDADVARLVVERHFIRDIQGNLRKFSTQEFRCVKCNEKFRRPPLIGQCTKCGSKLLFTVSEGSVIKYLEQSINLSKRYKLSPFLRQVLDLTKRRIESVFGIDKEKQEGLGKWFG
ncbi:MAG: DNA polymerase II large subunit [Nanoarchaeota archaeon]